MLTIEDATQILRAYRGRLSRQELITKGGLRCAVGVLAGEELGLGYPSTSSGNPYLPPVFQGEVGDCANRIGDCYGMSPRLVGRIIDWNDSHRLSASEIADTIELWVKEVPLENR